MFFDIHMLGKAGCIGKMRAIGNIILFIEVLDRLLPQFQALFKTTEGEALIFYFKTVWAAKQPARSEGISVLIVSAGDYVMF